MWFEFIQPDTSMKKVKLAWVSPLRSLYIFTTIQREEAFSLAADVLAQTFRDKLARMVEVDSIVNRALVDALEEAEADQQDVTEPASA